MGYLVWYKLKNVLIPTEKIPEALDAVNLLNSLEMKKLGKGGTWKQGQKVNWWFSWVDHPQSGKWETLQQAITAWRFNTLETSEGLQIMEFTGEKLGDEEHLFAALAPYVKSGAEISALGQENDRWRYTFTNNGIDLEELEDSE